MPAGARAGNPARARWGHDSIHGNRGLHRHPGGARLEEFEERRIQVLRFLAKDSRRDLNARGAKAIESSSPNPRVGVRVRGDHPTDSRGDDPCYAGRGSSDVAAGLEVDVERGAPGRLPHLEDLGFRVWASGAGVETLGKDVSVAHQDGAYRRVGRRRVLAQQGEFERPPHKTIVHGADRMGWRACAAGTDRAISLPHVHRAGHRRRKGGYRVRSGRESAFSPSAPKGQRFWNSRSATACRWPERA